MPLNGHLLWDMFPAFYILCRVAKQRRRRRSRHAAYDEVNAKFKSTK